MPNQMKKIIGLENWRLNDKFSNTTRFVEVTIYLKYPDIKKLLKDKPPERQKKVKAYLLASFDKLIRTGLFETYEIIGTTKKPGTIKTKILFTSLMKLERLSYIESIVVDKIHHAKEIIPQIENFYCVKMTVAIEIEGQIKGPQTIEERFVLIKAKSFEDAHRKINKSKKDYSRPYLNAKGQLVRWNIESIDDSYSIRINHLEDFNNPEGIELYSKLKTRRLTKERIWNGEIK